MSLTFNMTTLLWKLRCMSGGNTATSFVLLPTTIVAYKRVIVGSEDLLEGLLLLKKRFTLDFFTSLAYSLLCEFSSADPPGARNLHGLKLMLSMKLLL